MFSGFVILAFALVLFTYLVAFLDRRSNQNSTLSVDADRLHPTEFDQRLAERRNWKWQNSIAAGALVLTGAAVWFTYKSYSDSHDTLLATLSALDQYKVQANEAVNQRKIAQVSFEEQTRALIASNGVAWRDILTRDKDGFVNLYYANIGKNAVPVTVLARYYLSESDVDIKSGRFVAVLNNFCDKKYYYPSANIVFPSTSSTNFTTLKISHDHINQVIDGGGSIIVQGCFIYFDFDKLHTTPFCFVAAQKDFSASLASSPVCVDGGQYQ